MVPIKGGPLLGTQGNPCAIKTRAPQMLSNWGLPEHTGSGNCLWKDWLEFLWPIYEIRIWVMKLHLPFCLTVLLNTAQLVFVWYIENENHFVKTHNYHSISSLKIKSKHTQMKSQWLFSYVVHVMARAVLIWNKFWGRRGKAAPQWRNNTS